MSTLQFGQSRTASLRRSPASSASHKPRHSACCTPLAFSDPCSSSSSAISGNPSAEHAQALSSAPLQLSPSPTAPSRRHLLGGAALLSGIAALQSAASVLAPSPASARVSIADIKKGGEGERDIEVTASGIRMSLMSSGRGDPPASGSLVLVDVVGRLEDGSVFLDTRAEGAAPLAFQLGTTNKYVTEGLEQVVETMRGGDVKLAVVPPSLGYGGAGVTFRSGARVPPNAPLYYEVALLRCQTFTVGMACCSDADFPCVKNPEQDIDFTK